jgi:hypothetical protein
VAEFVQIMKDLRRMCIAADDGPDTTKCGNCPLGESRLCSFEISDIGDYELQEAETCVITWAAEHPEPVYPTWGEWFVKQSGLAKEWKNTTNPAWEANMAIGMFRAPIPADFAQKLGIEPKEPFSWGHENGKNETV